MSKCIGLCRFVTYTEKPPNQQNHLCILSNGLKINGPKPNDIDPSTGQCIQRGNEICNVATDYCSVNVVIKDGNVINIGS